MSGTFAFNSICIQLSLSSTLLAFINRGLLITCVIRVLLWFWPIQQILQLELCNGKVANFPKPRFGVSFIAEFAPAFSVNINVIAFLVIILHLTVHVSARTTECTSIALRHKNFAVRLDVYKCRDSFNGFTAHKQLAKTQKEKITQTYNIALSVYYDTINFIFY